MQGKDDNQVPARSPLEGFVPVRWISEEEAQEKLGLSHGGDLVRPQCRVYWGTHGCDLPRGHVGPHLCDCAGEDVNQLDGPNVLNVGGPPYYGPDTHFWGEDVEGQ